jgi:hypothetical protein
MIKRRKESDEDSESEGAAAEAARLATELSEVDDLPKPDEIVESGAEAGPSQPAGPEGGGWPGASRRVAEVVNSAGTGVQAITQAAARTVGRGGRGAPRRAADAISSAGTGVAASAQVAADRAGRGSRVAQRGMSSGVTWLVGQVEEMGPRLRIRNAETLRRQFPGRSDDDIAELLVERAGRAAAAVGGATGTWAALPVLPAFPVEVLAETLAVIGIELKLVAELHEVMGLPAPGSGTDRARAYLAAWAHRRGFFTVPGGFVLAAGSPLARMLRRRLAARVRRSAFSLAPLLTGALAGVLINHRETRKLGQQVLEDLRRHNREVGPVS